MVALHSFINRFQIVKQVPIFNQLNWFDLQRIARKSVLEQFKKGDIIREEGDPPDFFYCCISGRIQAFTINKDGKKDKVEFIHRGVHFGIISLLTGENHSLNYQAVNDSLVLKIAKEDFDQILKGIPELSMQLNRSLSKRVRNAYQGTKTVFESNIISVYSPVKGTGSSTYAVNLAYELSAQTRKNVVLVHLHPKDEKEEASSFEASPTWRVDPVDLDEIVGEHDKIMEALIKNDKHPIDILNIVFDKQSQSTHNELSHFVSALVGEYHYVIVDLPNQMDHIVQETLTQSDYVHLLTSDRKKDLELIKAEIDLLENNLKENFKEERIRVIIRAFHPKIYLSFEEIDKFIDYNVYTHLPLIQREELQVQISTETFSFKRCDEQSRYLSTVTRIAREIGGVRIGLVLGGGAALGIAHIGVLRVLEQEGIPVDIIAGSSMGALVGSFYCNGYTVDQCESAAREFEKKKDMLKLFDPFILPIAGIVGDRAIVRWLKKHLGKATFYGTRIPFKVVSYDLVRREELVLNSGSLVDAVRQSIAIPGVLEPVKEKERWIIDGGVLNPLPTNVLVGLGIKKIIAVNVLQSPEDVSEGFDIEQSLLERERKKPFRKNPFHYIGFRIGRLFAKAFNPNIADIIVRTLQASEYVIAEQSGQQADVVIHPDLVGIEWYELSRVNDLIKAGEEATRKVLPEIKSLVEE